jgi:hypothetical protein
VTTIASSTDNSLIEEMDKYLANTSTQVISLKAYPVVAMAFVKANSTLPSSAVVERLFSAAGQILCSRRCKLSDDYFNNMVFLRDRLKS